MSFAVVPLTAAVTLAQQPDSGDNGGQGQDFGKSSPVGLLVLILFLIAVVFLVRSMSKHLKRIPATFDKDAAPEAEPEAAEPVDTTAEKAVEQAVEEKKPDAAAGKKTD
ncbi:hypothetical protein [Amycolatopsis jejuensis]|uniref:hypothetical protein n=1 Tax=Amycolatopsis jejuensis TaxID=330084 RepID=UPI000524E7D5|nr:hypothetical protein [Amycolatopsis jejuensis]